MNPIEKHREYLPKMPAAETSKAITNGLLLANSLGLDQISITPGLTSGFHMVLGIETAYRCRCRNFGSSYDLFEIFKEKGTSRAQAQERIESFKYICDMSRLSTSYRLFDHPFTLFAQRENSRPLAIAVGFSPYLAPAMLDKGDMLSTFAVQDTVFSLTELAFKSFEDKYTTIVMPASQSLYYPGKTVNVIFFKRDWLQSQTFPDAKFEG